VVVFLDGVEVGRTTPGLMGAWKLTQPKNLLEGTYKVSAKALSAAQKVESEPGNTHTFTVDLTAPKVDVVVPANGAVTGRLPVIRGTVEEGSTVSIAVDDEVLGDAKVTGGAWTFTPTRELKSGSRKVTATARDTASNSAADSNTFTVNVPPTVVVRTPADGESTGTTPTFSGTVSDDGPGPLTVKLSVAGQFETALTVTGTSWSYTHTTSLPESPHTVTATVTDDANQTASDSNTFTVVKPTPPGPPTGNPPTGNPPTGNPPTGNPPTGNPPTGNPPKPDEPLAGAPSDRSFLGGGFGCAASGGQPSALAMMGLAVVSVLLARRRQR
jgi:uncharacterized protein (TIGR03382 family)